MDERLNMRNVRYGNLCFVVIFKLEQHLDPLGSGVSGIGVYMNRALGVRTSISGGEEVFSNPEFPSLP